MQGASFNSLVHGIHRISMLDLDTRGWSDLVLSHLHLRMRF
jgi:hypothetical protein